MMGLWGRNPVISQGTCVLNVLNTTYSERPLLLRCDPEGLEPKGKATALEAAAGLPLPIAQAQRWRLVLPGRGAAWGPARESGLAAAQPKLSQEVVLRRQHIILPVGPPTVQGSGAGTV